MRSRISIRGCVCLSVRRSVRPSHMSWISEKWADFEQNSVRNIRLCHLKDNSETSTLADRQNASVVWTLFNLFSPSSSFLPVSFRHLFWLVFWFCFFSAAAFLSSSFFLFSFFSRLSDALFQSGLLDGRPSTYLSSGHLQTNTCNIIIVTNHVDSN